MLRILGRTSSINVRKVLWTAAEVGTAFELDEAWAATRDVRSPEFLALNPNGLVPVLEDEHGVLWESNTICRYLAAKAGRIELLPDQPFARAQVEKWMDWQAGDLNAAWRPAFMALVRRHPDFLSAPDAVERSIAQWNGLMMLLEQQLARTGAYAAGPGFTLADVVLGLSVQRWLLTPMPRPEAPAIAAYRDRLLARPAVRARLSPDTP
jgi:glutathione S-transferase